MAVQLLCKQWLWVQLLLLAPLNRALLRLRHIVYSGPVKGLFMPVSRSFIYRRIVHRHGRTLRARGATPHLPLPFHARLRYNPLVHSSTLKILVVRQSGR